MGETELRRARCAPAVRLKDLTTEHRTQPSAVEMSLNQENLLQMHLRKVPLCLYSGD